MRIVQRYACSCGYKGKWLPFGTRDEDNDLFASFAAEHPATCTGDVTLSIRREEFAE